MLDVPGFAGYSASAGLPNQVVGTVEAAVLGVPFDTATSMRPGARFGPAGIRDASLLLRPWHPVHEIDVFASVSVVDAGDVEMPGVEGRAALDRLEHVVQSVAGAGSIPVVLGGDHTITWPNVTGVARAIGWGRVSVIHFDAHADTGNLQFGSLIGHGLPMRRLIESGACRGDRFLQLGLRGYWPEPETLHWMAEQRMRSFEMHEIVRRGLDACLEESFAIATDGCDGVFVSVDIDVTDPGSAPGTGTPEPGGLTPRQLLDAVRRIAIEMPVVGMDVVEVSPPYDGAGQPTALAAANVAYELLALHAVSR